MSLTALFGLALGTAAMTIVLSAFAGLEELISEQFEDANADLKLSPVDGPYLNIDHSDSLFLSGLKSNFSDTKIFPIYKKRVLLTYGNNQHIAYLLVFRKLIMMLIKYKITSSLRQIPVSTLAAIS